MSAHRTLLVELGTEELPVEALTALGHAFAEGVRAELEKAGVEAGAAHALYAPRRLAVRIDAVATGQPEQHNERRGPAVKAALDAEGRPTRALEGFAASCGVDIEALERIETPKGAWFMHRSVTQGASTASLLPGVLEEVVARLPVPRPMRWGDHDYSFVRPVHWLLVLFGEQIVDVELMGLRSGRMSRGHRFHHPGPVHVADAESYVEQLRGAKVMVDPEERERAIREGTRGVGLKADLDLHPDISDSLCQALVNLTEWPVPILCRFDEAFLELPSEVLRTTMEVHQRFIPVNEREAGRTRLSSWFFGIANIESREPESIRTGYERVIRPRFADAKFFYDADLKEPLASHRPALETIIYQQDLGSVWDKSVRVAELARVIANRLGVDAALVTRAAELSRCDLVTRMVGEFPELQGIMGSRYAYEDGEPEEVWKALREFYMPRQAGDRIARGGVARVLAVADRIDTVAGIFAVGLRPSGNKDPFALRRAALGLARTLIEGESSLDLPAAFREALELLPDALFAGGDRPTREALAGELAAFVRDRLRGYYLEQGFSAEQFEAVAAVDPVDLLDFDRRLRAVADFAQRPESASLAAANKRVGNLLRKEASESAASAQVRESLFESDAERDLAEAVAQARARTEPLMHKGQYGEALAQLAALQAPVDRFFEDVMVMADDDALRGNRLALLSQLHHLFYAIADIARL